MEFERYRPWHVSGLEGDTTSERAYYVCPRCEGQTLLPFGPEAPVAGGALETFNKALEIRKTYTHSPRIQYGRAATVFPLSGILRFKMLGNGT